MILNWYERKNSPFIVVQYAKAGEPRQFEKTTIRKDDPDKEIKIARKLNTIEAMLLQESGDVASSGWGWVQNFLRAKYASREATLKIYTAQWGSILNFLLESDISSPEQIIREHVFEYLNWRTSQVKKKSGKQVKVNTAIGEIKLWGLLMDEAVLRKRAQNNPLRDHGIEPEESDVKPEYDEATIIEIYDRLLSRGAFAKTEHKPEAMFLSFHIALNTGLRFKDTAIQRTQMRWATDQIVIDRPKGGRKKEFAIPIYPAIREVLENWYHNTRRPVLWEMSPQDRKMSGLIWHDFFHTEMQHPDLCFHCTRVTFITAGLRAGIPEAVMMKMVNHGSTLINRIYQRWTSDDVRRYSAQIAIPGAPVSTSQNRSRKSSPQIKGNPSP